MPTKLLLSIELNPMLPPLAEQPQASQSSSSRATYLRNGLSIESFSVRAMAVFKARIEIASVRIIFFICLSYELKKAFGFLGSKVE
ncbi:hypothetical protein D9M72_391750 [compost metagenome]